MTYATRLSPTTMVGKNESGILNNKTECSKKSSKKSLQFRNHPPPTFSCFAGDLLENKKAITTDRWFL